MSAGAATARVNEGPGDRTVLVGVSGGIAIYKAVEFVRALVREGFRPLVVETEAARRFVMPLTFAAVSQAPVLDDDTAWQASGGWFQHIDAAREAGVMVVAPATANTLAKMAGGMADNLLTSIYLAFRGPVIVAPTMNWAMYEHAATQENLRVLEDRGVEVLGTGRGELACGEEGQGRMAEPETILQAVRRAFAARAAGPLAGRTVVVTSGGTRERIDAVRYIGNRSSGKMGRAVADEAYLRGAHVVLVTTQEATDAPFDVRQVESADEMGAAVQAATAEADVLVMAAAVADFKPRQAERRQDRAGRARDAHHRARTHDRRAGFRGSSRSAPRRVRRRGRAPDRPRPREEGREGRRVARLQRHPGAGVGIGSDENEITILGAGGEVRVPRTSKRRCAIAIVDAIEQTLEVP